jgi:hypothetical protein
MMVWERGRGLMGAGMLIVACGSSSDNHDGGDNGGGGAGRGGTAAGGGDSGADAGTSATSGASTTATGWRYFEPGTRLKPLVSRAGDVELIEGPDHLGWFDSELDMPCAFRVGTDGVERCFPAEGMIQALYADATCTAPVYVHYRTCGNTPPAHVTFDHRSGQACSIEPYRMGQELPSTAGVYSNSTGKCQRIGRPDTTATSIWALEAEVLETFVAVERTHEDWRRDLDAEIREGADGSFELIAFFNLIRGEACRPLGPTIPTAVPGTCVPPFRSWSGGYGDAACAARLISGSDLCVAWKPTTSLTLRAVPDSCPATTTFDLKELGESIETPIYADDGSGACVVADPEPVQGFLEGAPIYPDSLPSVDIVEVGSGPVRARYFGAGDRPLFPDRNGPSPFFVAASGEACSPYPFSDGVRRCIPESFASAGESELFFADPSCTGERLFRFEPADCTAETPEPRGLVIRNDDPCNPAIAETLGFSGTSSAPSVYRWLASNSTCQEDSVSSYPGSIFYIAGEPLDPNALFTEIERAIEE